jgi:outer membrane receptor for ferrienterochelin and colicins
VGRVHELSFHPSISRRFGERLRLHARLYFTEYRAENDDRFSADNSLFDATFFEQQFLRPEVQAEYFAGENHIFTLGSGRSNESVSATRYTEKQYFANTYLYFLHEWTVSEKLSLHSGGRLDAHSVYGTRFSPKLAGRYGFNEKLSLKLNLAAGFKAPDFRQLYLNFTNNSIGYSVFGTHEAAARLEELEAKGVVSERLQAPTDNLQAEHSIAFNAELSYQPIKKLHLKISTFHNEVFQKIETFALARKTNAQFVFSYANLGQIYTQGADLNANYDLTKHFRLSGNYQLLYAKDRDVLAGLERGEYFTRNPETLQTRRLTKRDYTGLFNRSRHTLSVGFYFQHEKLNATLRGVYRSKFGLADRNGNLILDDEREFARGFLLLNATVSRSLWKERLQLQGGVENVLNYIDPVGQPGLPGRLFFFKVNATIF